MLKKIIKHDFILIRKIYIPIFIGAILITLFCILLHKANFALTSRDIHYLETATNSMDILMYIILIAIPTLTFIFLTAIFYKTVAGDQGYLIHTLPVAKRDIVVGKNLVGLFFNVISILITLFCLLLFFACTDPETHVFSKTIVPTITDITSAFLQPETLFMHPGSLLALILFLLSLLTQNYANISYGFLCVSLGQMMNKHKIIYTILFGIIINMALSTASSVILSILTIVTVNFNMNDLGSYLDAHHWGTINIFALSAFVINLAFAAICNFVSVKLLDTKLNLD